MFFYTIRVLWHPRYFPTKFTSPRTSSFPSSSFVPSVSSPSSSSSPHFYTSHNRGSLSSRKAHITRNPQQTENASVQRGNRETYVDASLQLPPRHHHPTTPPHCEEDVWTERDTVAVPTRKKGVKEGSGGDGVPSLAFSSLQKEGSPGQFSDRMYKKSFLERPSREEVGKNKEGKGGVPFSFNNNGYRKERKMYESNTCDFSTDKASNSSNRNSSWLPSTVYSSSPSSSSWESKKLALMNQVWFYLEELRQVCEGEVVEEPRGVKTMNSSATSGASLSFSSSTNCDPPVPPSSSPSSSVLGSASRHVRWYAVGFRVKQHILSSLHPFLPPLPHIGSSFSASPESIESVPFKKEHAALSSRFPIPSSSSSGNALPLSMVEESQQNERCLTHSRPPSVSSSSLSSIQEGPGLSLRVVSDEDVEKVIETENEENIKACIPEGRKKMCMMNGEEKDDDGGEGGSEVRYPISPGVKMNEVSLSESTAVSGACLLSSCASPLPEQMREGEKKEQEGSTPCSFSRREMTALLSLYTLVEAEDEIVLRQLLRQLYFTASRQETPLPPSYEKESCTSSSLAGFTCSWNRNIHGKVAEWLLLLTELKTLEEPLLHLFIGQDLCVPNFPTSEKGDALNKKISSSADEQRQANGENVNVVVAATTRVEDTSSSHSLSHPEMLSGRGNEYFPSPSFSSTSLPITSIPDHHYSSSRTHSASDDDRYNSNETPAVPTSPAAMSMSAANISSPPNANLPPSSSSSALRLPHVSCEKPLLWQEIPHYEDVLPLLCSGVALHRLGLHTHSTFHATVKQFRRLQWSRGADLGKFAFAMAKHRKQQRYPYSSSSLRKTSLSLSTTTAYSGEKILLSPLPSLSLTATTVTTLPFQLSPLAVKQLLESEALLNAVILPRSTEDERGTEEGQTTMRETWRRRLKRRKEEEKEGGVLPPSLQFDISLFPLLLEWLDALALSSYRLLGCVQCVADLLAVNVIRYLMYKKALEEERIRERGEEGEEAFRQRSSSERKVMKLNRIVKGGVWGGGEGRNKMRVGEVTATTFHPRDEKCFKKKAKKTPFRSLWPIIPLVYSPLVDPFPTTSLSSCGMAPLKVEAEMLSHLLWTAVQRVEQMELPQPLLAAALQIVLQLTGKGLLVDGGEDVAEGGVESNRVAFYDHVTADLIKINKAS